MARRRPSKRKSADVVSPATPVGEQPDASCSAKKKQKVETTASSSRPSRTLLNAASASRLTTAGSDGTPISSPNSGKANGTQMGKRSVGLARKGIARKVPRKFEEPSEVFEDEESSEENSSFQAKVSVNVNTKKKTKIVETSDHEADADGPQYWLMKAEPESRIEKGKEVKFSIDDLKAATNPEAWDGVRNLEARNNMRIMMQGDQAFFYHSNCKVPGIVGLMEIVREHSVDESAFDPEHPYYDEKSTRGNPKWQVVHVEFRQKFPDIIKLKDLQKFSKESGVLENMQTLKRSRLSVSKVTKKEWDFIMSLVSVEDLGPDSAAHQPQMINQHTAAKGPTKRNTDQHGAATGNGTADASEKATASGGIDEKGARY